VERLDLAGIPVLWTDGPEPVTAGLALRGGIADETGPLRGITHMVEHLTMFATGRRAHPANAFVDLVRTVFHARRVRRVRRAPSCSCASGRWTSGGLRGKQIVEVALDDVRDARVRSGFALDTVLEVDDEGGRATFADVRPRAQARAVARALLDEVVAGRS